MALPIFQTAIRELSMLQTQWASQLNSIIAKPINNGIILPSVSLTVGANVINHRLDRKLQGWVITRMRTNFSEIYDTQDTNNIPDKTLNLNSSAAVVVDILVF